MAIKYLLIFLILPVNCISQVYPSGIVYFIQGENNNGNAVAISRSNPLNALSVPENSDIQMPFINFVSLGFGGYIALELDTEVVLKPETFIKLYETTYNYECNSYPEEANIYLSSNNLDYTFIGTTCVNNNTVFYPFSYIDTVRYVLIEDISNVFDFTQNQVLDGYDVDGLVFDNATFLPIELDDFSANYVDNSIYVSFNTLSEYETLKFDVQWSKDAINFQSLHVFQANGYSSVNQVYDAIIPFVPLTDITYLRIVETDINNVSEAYKIIAIKNIVKNKIPNNYDLLGKDVYLKNNYFFYIEK